MTVSIGVAGLGTVGVGVIKGVHKNAEILKMRTGKTVHITAVSARSKGDRGVDVSPYTWFDDARQLATSPDIDVFIEVIGGSTGIALDSVKNALKAGKVVITANKAMLAEHGEQLEKIACRNGTYILFEAAIGGGIPVVKALREGLSGNIISRIYGILNGTCNYILTTIEKTGQDFADVLQQAQQLGYAESDPSFDIDGVDAAQKLALLASLAFGIQGAYGDMHIESIRNCMDNLDVHMAGDLGFTPRLVGVAEYKQNGVQLYMAPAFVSKTGTFGGVDDVVNACTLQGDLIGSMSLMGPGAGGDATASAILSDICDVATRTGGQERHMFNQPVETLQPAYILPMDERVGRYYVRITGDNSPLMAQLGKHGVQVLDSHMEHGSTALITTPIQEKTMKTAITDIQCVLHRIEEC